MPCAERCYRRKSWFNSHIRKLELNTAKDTARISDLHGRIDGLERQLRAAESQSAEAAHKRAQEFEQMRNTLSIEK